MWVINITHKTVYAWNGYNQSNNRKRFNKPPKMSFTSLTWVSLFDLIRFSAKNEVEGWKTNHHPDFKRISKNLFGRSVRYLVVTPFVTSFLTQSLNSINYNLYLIKNIIKNAIIICSLSGYCIRSKPNNLSGSHFTISINFHEYHSSNWP